MTKTNLIGAIKGLAKLICISPDIEQKKAIRLLRFLIVKSAHEIYPDYSNSQLSQVTGVSRGEISSFIKQNEPSRIFNRDSQILAELWRYRDKNNSIKLKGTKSYYSIAKGILRSSYKPEATLNTLIKCDAVAFNGDSLIIKSKVLDCGHGLNRLSSLASKNIERYVDTLLYNFNDENKDKLYDQIYSSTKISKYDLIATHKKIKDYLNNVAYKKIQEIIDDSESDVPVGTYPVYSISLFEYKEVDS